MSKNVIYVENKENCPDYVKEDRKVCSMNKYSLIKLNNTNAVASKRYTYK